MITGDEHRLDILILYFLISRAEFSAPLFKSGLTKAENVKVGDILTGRVNNVTHFGAFVDIGIGINGLIHVTKMRGGSSFRFHVLI